MTIGEGQKVGDCLPTCATLYRIGRELKYLKHISSSNVNFEMSTMNDVFALQYTETHMLSINS